MMDKCLVHRTGILRGRIELFLVEVNVHLKSQGVKLRRLHKLLKKISQKLILGGGSHTSHTVSYIE